MKPPIADSSASTISTPVIDSGDSCTWCSTSGSIRDGAKNVEPQQAEHVERGHQRGRRATPPTAPGAAARLREGEPEDLVLREEAGERRDAGDRRGGDREGPEGDRDPLRQPAHLADVLLAAQRVDHAAGAEEQAGLEERVRDDVEDRHAVGAHAERQRT